MTVIDVDSHYYEPFEWLTETDPELAAMLPQIDKITLVVTTAFGEVLSTLPPHLRPNFISQLPKELIGDATELSPEMIAIGEQFLAGWLGSVKGAHDPADRLAFCDDNGIDRQFVLPTFAFNPISYVRREMPDQAARLLSAYNRWTLGNLAGHTDRLMPAGIVDLKFMTEDVLLVELKTLREGGARTVLFWPSPVDGKSIAHPDFEWFWAGCSDLGIMPMVHVGAGRPNVDLGWMNNGRPFPLSLVSYFAQLHQIPELVLSELVAAGTFDRHPNLRVLVSELGVAWLPSFLDRLDGLAKAGGKAWPYEMLPSGYLRRQVRVSPLEADRVGDVVATVGSGLVVFASDYPHPEGGSDAVKAFTAQFEGTVDDLTAADFFGTTIERDLLVGA